MTTVPALRIAKVRSEILSVLLKIYVNDSPVLIWQKDDKEKRVLNTAKISNLDENIGVFYLKATDGVWSKSINGELALYFKGEEESILFKAKNLIVQKDELIVPIPTEVRLLEKRYEPRIHVDQTNPHNSFVIEKIYENGKRKDFRVRVIDVSITGAAFAITKADGKFFYEKDSLFITQVGEIPLIDTIPGNVIYLKPVDFSEGAFRGKGFRVGVQFARYLTSDHLKLFNKS